MLSNFKAEKREWKLLWLIFLLCCKFSFRSETKLYLISSLAQNSLSQRVQFNRETLQPYKSQAYVKFGENLYMDRFMYDADPIKKSKSKAIQIELNDCRERIRLLAEGKVSHKNVFVVINYSSNCLGKPIYILLGIHQILPGRIARCIRARNRR